VTGLAAGAALGLAAAVAFLLTSLVSIRFVLGVRRRRRAELRPRLERELATFLAADDVPTPVVPQGALALALVRDVALEALAELRGRERSRLTRLLEQHGVVDDAVRGLDARSARRRLAAADALALIRSERAEAALEQHLADGNGAVRLACARALAELGSERAGADVAAAVTADPGADRGAAADALLALGANRPDDLGRLLEPGTPAAVQAIAAAVAGELRLAQHAGALRSLLDSGDDEVAARAARGLGLIGVADAVRALIELIEDAQRAWFVRAAAARALGTIGDIAAMPALTRLLAVDDWVLQSNAAGALAALGGPGAEALREALGSRHKRVREHARVALEGAS